MSVQGVVEYDHNTLGGSLAHFPSDFPWRFFSLALTTLLVTSLCPFDCG